VKLDRNKYLESRSFKPVTLLVAILAVNVVLGLIVFFFPTEGIAISDNTKLKFITLEELKGDQNKAPVEIDIENVLQGISLSENSEEDSKKTPLATKGKIDPAQKSDTNNVPFYRSIQLPPQNPNALKTLIHALKYESKSKTVRILHYGDSQLEGDRITDYVRNRMQLRFGGEGPGIVLPKEPAASSRRAVFVSESKNFKKKAIYVRGAAAEDGMYGIGGSSFEISGAYSTFSSWVQDSVSEENSKANFTNKKQATAYIKIKNGYSGYKVARSYSKATLLYHTDQPFQVNLRADNYVNDYVLNPAYSIGKYTWSVSPQKSIKLSFTKGKFPTVYGVALDGAKGVAVDNFAMRGSSALGFDKMNKVHYSRQLKEMNVRCVVLQYGINVVPNVRSDYGYYKNILVRQLNSIKAAYPGVSIIVIGPSDMSKNNGGQKVSYTNVPLIRDAMKEAAFETGSCFWDLYEAMGGENSMVAWVNKGLGQKDYTHFSFKGAKYVGEMFYEAIMQEIDKEI
jgi:lysophospholipase L1-like esterase